jgi:hypothetical protein
MDVNEYRRPFMVRLSLRATCTWSALFLLANATSAQQKAYDLLPDTVQAVVWIPDGEQLIERWDRTQLSQLASDPAVRPFFDEQRQAIEDRFMDAGWRLSVTPEELNEFSAGQIAMAWLEKPESPRKPFALALLADVEDDAATNQRLIDSLDEQLSLRKPQKKETLQHLGISIAKYTMPKRADQLLAENSYYAIADGQLVATDDEDLMRSIVSRIKKEPVAGNVLSSDPVFVAGRTKAEISGKAQVEYFVRPLGIARVLRSIGGKRSKSNADMLVVLENQGFKAIQCVCGEVTLGQEQVDMQHRGFALVERPLTGSVGILDFPNAVTRKIPNFVGKDISSLLEINWNAKEAFWKAEGLVDELLGTAGAFKEVIEGIKKDPNGPRIDIAADVLPQLTNDIYAIADSKAGVATVDSRRNLIAIKVKNAAAMAKVLDRAMRNEPDAELLEVDGQQVWKVVHKDDELVIGLEDDFGEFGGGTESAAAQNDPQPWLSNWAITVQAQEGLDGYLMFASHVELIEDAIAQVKLGLVHSPLEDEDDYKRVAAAIDAYFMEQPMCVWQIVRNSTAYRVQYELFREGKLRDSESMLSSILDRLLQSDTEIKEKVQVLKGNNLPPFENIAKFLQPSGMMVRATDSGWEFGGLLLSADMNLATPQVELSSEVSSVGTARAPSEAEANR